MKAFFLPLFILAVSSACDPVDDRLVILNKSNDTAYYLITEYENLGRMYNQKLAEKGINITFRNYVYDLPEGGRRRHSKIGSSAEWENFIEKVCENRRLHIFTFNIDTLRRYGWKEIIENGKFKERMDYSLPEVKRLNWKIELD